MEEVIRKIAQIQESGFPTPRTFEWLLEYLEKKVEKDRKSRVRYKIYFEENKDKLYKYHRDYRTKHPEYEAKKRERARLKRKVIY